MSSTRKSAGDLVDGVRAPVVLCAADGRVVHANAAGRELLCGATEVTALGVPAAALAAAQERGRTTLSLGRHSWHFLGVDVEGESLLLASVEPDARRATRLLDALVDHLPVGVMVFDAQGEMVRMNAEHRRFVELPAEVNPVGQVNVLTSAMSPTLKQAYAEAYAGRVATLTEERVTRSPLAAALNITTEERLFDLVAFPVRDEAGAIEAVIAIVTNVTSRVHARRQAEAERSTLERMLSEERQAQGLTALAGGIAHSFNNLLTRVLSETASNQGDDASVRTALQRIEDAALQMSTLTAQLSAYAGQGPARRERLRLDDTVRQYLDLRAPLLPAGMRPSRRLDAPSAVVEATPKQLREVVHALVENATEALTENATVAVRTRLESAGGQPRWVLTVTDDGVGMSEELAARAFDPFVSSKGAGRGLGLAAVKGTVAQLAGTISLRSAPGQGTMVEIALPCRDEPVAASEAPEAPRRRARPKSLTNVRVLLVDDDDSVRSSITRLLSIFGAKVVAAPSGEAALVEAERATFDVIFLDVLMPEMDGWQTLARLRENGISTPVMMVSGHSHQPPAAQAAMANGFLAKPFTLSELEAALRVLGIPPRR